MRDTERIPLDALEEIIQLKRELRDLRATTLKRIHDSAIPFEIVLFTSNGSFVKADHPGLKTIRIRLVGGGGGGGGCPTTNATQAVSGGGGGGGGYAEAMVKAFELAASEVISIGGGGNGGAAGQFNGVGGGATEFQRAAGGDFARATGGFAGQSIPSSSNLPKYGGSGGSGGTGTEGDIQLSGDSGEMTVLFETQVGNVLGGQTQLSPTTGRHVFTFTGFHGDDGVNYGAGAGGGVNADDQTTARTGGDGADGVVIVDLFF